MPLDISVPLASLVSLWVESVIYGAYVVLFCLCTYVLLFVRRKPNGVNKPLLVAAIMMFAFSTAHVVTELVQAIRTFIHDGGALRQDDPVLRLLTNIQRVFYVTNNIVADGLLIYRCYTVWGSRWKVVAIPMLMLISTAVCGYVAVYEFSQSLDSFTQTCAAWVTVGFFCLSLTTNLLVTSLIAGRIYWIGRQLGSGNRYNYSMAIVLESGALYSATLLIWVVLLSLQVVSGFIVYSALAQITGIVPTLIIVRIGLGISTQDTHVVGTTASSSHRLSAPMQVRMDVNVDTDGSESYMKHSDV